MNYRKMAEEITSGLQLESPPVALSFVEVAPAEIPPFDREVPAACSFWRQAESTVFYASAEKHFNCPIGTRVLGFDMPEAVQRELRELAQKMVGCGYIAPEEPEKLPALKKKKSGIVYGPLRDFPLEPDLILVWLTPRQAMLYAEAARTCRWTEALPTPTWGRPACAALPVTAERAQPVLSLGCMGMRTFTEVGGDRLLAVLPGEKARDFLEALRSTLEANETMRLFYEGHKAKFA